MRRADVDGMGGGWSRITDVEAELVAWLKEHVPSEPFVELGIGDDAAVLARGSCCVVTVDMLADGTHFSLDKTKPLQVGYKALGVNLSDLAAMAARPRAAVVGLTLPRRRSLELAIELFEGMLPLARRHGVAIVGGDTNTWSGPLVISVTVLGEPAGEGPLTRAGARPGDQIFVTGHLGGSGLGWHLRFEPRVREALALHSGYTLHAGMDISDGLAMDLHRMARASRCGAEVEVAQIPLSDAAHQAASESGHDAVHHALSDGEDFELLLAVDPETAARMASDRPLDIPLTRIGQFTSSAQITRIGPNGQRFPLEPTGYLHGQDP